MKTDLPPLFPELYQPELYQQVKIKFISQPKNSIHFDAFSEKEIFFDCIYPCKYCILLYGEEDYLNNVMTNYFKRRLQNE
jgi:hypothetical protein